MENKKKGELIRHPKREIDVKWLLQKYLNEVDEIESIVIHITYKDDTGLCEWSRQNIKNLAYAIKSLEREFNIECDAIEGKE